MTPEQFTAFMQMLEAIREAIAALSDKVNADGFIRESNRDAAIALENAGVEEEEWRSWPSGHAVGPDC